MAFLHGVETIQLTSGQKQITGVRSAVIGIVGTAPQGATNTLIQVVSQADGAALGSPLPGFTIPKAIEARDAHGYGTMLVVNVYDPAEHNESITGEAQTVVDGKAALDYAPMTTPVIQNQASEPLTAGTHYTIDAFGRIKFTAQALNGVTEVLAIGSLKITGGSASPAGAVATVTVNGVNVLGASVPWNTSDEQTASDVADQINTYTSSPNYTAVAVDDRVDIYAIAGTGSGPNTFAVSGTVTGSATIGAFVAMAGGVDAETATTAITADYERFDPSLVTNSQIIGAIDPGTNARTGFELLKMGMNTYGFNAKLIICPGYSAISAISTKMATVANSLKAKYFIDGPLGAIPSQIITGRGPSGSINFNTSDPRAILCYPYVKAYDLATEADELRPYSQYLAALICQIDVTAGASYAQSPSNNTIQGITGVERIIEWIINADCEANQLNANGVVTIFTAFGLGFRAWGNRTAAYPSNTEPVNFISVGRTADILHESVEQATLPFIDLPITPALIDAIIATVEGFMRTLEGLGRLLPGSTCKYLPEDNPSTEVAAGHLTFSLNFMPPTPAERITYKSLIDINLLQQLNAA